MTASEDAKKTPLYQKHVDLGARMTPFAGYEMPVQYAGIIDEHLAVRNAAGMFDVSHMGEIFIRGPHAAAFVQHLITNDIATLYDGRVLYAVMCREDGGIVDDLLVYRIGSEEYLLVVNAANREKDLDWMIQNNAAKAAIDDVSDETALIAVQGPDSLSIVEKALGEPIDDLKYYHFRSSKAGPLRDCDTAIVSRTGYTGEKGIEIYCDSETGPRVWDAVMEAGADAGLQPAGLGARDTLRIEAGFCLYGSDITEETNPLEAGLGWLTKLDKDDFIGKSALQRKKADGLNRRLIAFVMHERAIPRSGYPLLAPNDTEIGVVTSGTQSPILQRGIGMGYIADEPRYWQPGSEIYVGVRDRSVPGEVRKPPLHKA